MLVWKLWDFICTSDATVVPPLGVVRQSWRLSLVLSCPQPVYHLRDQLAAKNIALHSHCLTYNYLGEFTYTQYKRWENAKHRHQLYPSITFLLFKPVCWKDETSKPPFSCGLPTWTEFVVEPRSRLEGRKPMLPRSRRLLDSPWTKFELDGLDACSLIGRATPNCGFTEFCTQKFYYHHTYIAGVITYQPFLKFDMLLAASIEIQEKTTLLTLFETPSYWNKLAFWELRRSW